METILFGIGTALALVCFVVLLVMEHKNEKHLDDLSTRLASMWETGPSKPSSLTIPSCTPTMSRRPRL